MTTRTRTRSFARRIISRLAVTVALISAFVAGVVLSPDRAGATSAPNPVVAENQNPGTTDWRITLTPSDDINQQILGYAGATSVNVGDTISLYVTVHPAEAYAIDVYRVGYYQGLGGRLMQHIGPLSGVAQPACPADPATGMVACNWAPSYQLAIPSTWTSGIYLAKLTNTDGYQNYIVFAVRDDARHSALLYQQSVTTYEAYNNFPNDPAAGQTLPQTGKSLYEYNSSPATTSYGTTRAVQVSFDRPYANDDGAGDFLDWEMYMVRWIEQNGYDVSYSTDIDTDTSGAQLLSHGGFLSVGHDEYWTSQMVDNVTAARNAGVGLGFFGANAMYWQIRLNPSAVGTANRVITCYKSAALDPVQGPTTTVNFRNPSVNRPEQTLIGEESTGQQPSGALPASYVAANTSNWVYAGTNLHDGDSIPNIVGYETDRQVAGTAIPSAIPGTYTLLSTSPYTTAGGGTDYAQSSIYQAGSGAWVFDAGSIEWSWGLYNYNRANYADPRIQQITANVLNAFVQGVTTPPPLAPTNLIATPASSSSIQLSWGASSGPNLQYVLQQSTTPTFSDAVTTVIPGGQTAYTVTQLGSGSFYFRIQASDSGGSSPFTPTAAASTQSYYSAVTGTIGVQDYWRLGETGGVLAADSVGSANGAYMGSVALGQPGAIQNDPDTSAGFDGTTAKVSLPALAQVTDFSIEAWSCLPAGWSGANSTLYGTTGTVRLLARPGGTASATEFYAGVWLGGVEYALQPKSTASNTGTCVQWVLTRSGAILTLYRNGAQIGQRTDLPANTAADVSGWIGAQSGTTYYAVGRIDDVSVYGTAMSADVVASHYVAATNGIAPPPPPQPPSYVSAITSTNGLMSYWRLDESTGPSARDSVGSSNGTYVGGVQYGAAGAITNDPDTSVAFNGTNAKVQLPSITSVTDFSIEAWSCLPAGWAGTNSTVYGGSGTVRVLARAGGSGLSAYAGVTLGGTEYVLQPGHTASNLGVCVQWVLTRSGPTLSLYRNGTLIGQRADLPATTPANISGWIGAQGGTTYYAVGRIDDVSIYSVALSWTVVAAHYQAAVSGPAPTQQAALSPAPSKTTAVTKPAATTPHAAAPRTTKPVTKATATRPSRSTASTPARPTTSVATTTPTSVTPTTTHPTP